MPIASMTGFARGEGADAADVHPGLHWAWEVKSVNGRNLDVRCRLPIGFEALESVARAAAAERFKRGNMSISLTLSRGGEPRDAGAQHDHVACHRLPLKKRARCAVLTRARTYQLSLWPQDMRFRAVKMRPRATVVACADDAWRPCLSWQSNAAL